jgi:hypothetical protein
MKKISFCLLSENLVQILRESGSVVDPYSYKVLDPYPDHPKHGLKVSIIKCLAFLATVRFIKLAWHFFCLFVCGECRTKIVTRDVPVPLMNLFLFRVLFTDDQND